MRQTTMTIPQHESADEAVKNGRAFIKQTRAKMETLVQEFADGKLNREQFHTLYERYQSQISGVQTLLFESDPTRWAEILDGEETIDIRSRLMAKATGMLIYTRHNGTLLEELGQFDVDPLQVSLLLKQLWQVDKKEDNLSFRTTTEGVPDFPQIVAEMAEGGWLFLARGNLTIIVMSFSKEPISHQRETILQLLNDFERANVAILKRSNITANELVMPFKVAIRRAKK